MRSAERKNEKQKRKQGNGNWHKKGDGGKRGRDRDGKRRYTDREGGEIKIGKERWRIIGVYVAEEGIDKTMGEL